MEFRARAVVFINCLKCYTWMSKISVSALMMDNTSTTLASLREFNWHCTIKVFFGISFLLNLLTVNFPHYIETSQLICIANVCNRNIPILHTICYQAQTQPWSNIKIHYYFILKVLARWQFPFILGLAQWVTGSSSFICLYHLRRVVFILSFLEKPLGLQF